MSTQQRNVATIAAAVKLGVFTVVSVLVTGLLAAIMGNIGFGAGQEYTAVFTSASMLEKGDDVRVAGVSVGEVRSVEHHERSQALVTFRVKADVELTTSSRAEIRFLNLVGDRYLALEDGRDGDTAPAQDPADPIPAARTSPALDLTTLFNGFKPLFQALRPEQVNELSLNLVQVLQGEGGTVAGLLRRTASLTGDLAERDELIGRVVTNLDETLRTVDSRHSQLTRLVVELKRWMGDLARDRRLIGSSLGSISELTEEVADLLTRGRPLLEDDVAELRRLARLLNQPRNREVLVELVERLPESMTDQTRTGTYGSWYNYYLCGFSGKITLPELEGIPGLDVLLDQLNDLEFHSTAPRCNGAGEDGSAGGED